MIKVGFVRGAYLNKYEWQNYNINNKNIKVTPISSIHPLNTINDGKKLLSLTDINNSKILNYIANRTIGDSQILIRLKGTVKDFDILHTADPHYYYSYQLAKLKENKPLISTYWDTIPFNNESTISKRRIKKYAMDKTDLFISHTQKAKKCLETEGIRNKRIEVIPLGVDLTRFKPKKNTNKKFKTVLFVGRLVEEKGILDLYQAFKNCLYLNYKNKLKLLIVGKGPLKRKLLKQIKKDGLQNSISIKDCAYDLIHLIYQKADIFILSSRATTTWEEQYGMVLIEAMASGLPIIAYDSGAIGEVLQKTNILVKEGNIQTLTESMHNLLKDKEMLIKMSEKSRKLAEKRYNCIKYKEKISYLYKSLI